MESGSELSKTVATFILQKILLDESGLSYICQTYDRFSHVAMILVNMHNLYLTILKIIFNTVKIFRVKWYYHLQRILLQDFSSML